MNYTTIFNELSPFTQAAVILAHSQHPSAPEETEIFGNNRTQEQGLMILKRLRPSSEVASLALEQLIKDRFGTSEWESTRGMTAAVEEFFTSPQRKRQKIAEEGAAHSPQEAVRQILKTLLKEKKYAEAYRLAQEESKVEKPEIRAVANHFIGHLLHLHGESVEPKLTREKCWESAKERQESALREGDRETQAEAHLALGTLLRLLSRENLQEPIQHYEVAIREGNKETAARAHYNLVFFYRLKGEAIAPKTSPEGRLKKAAEHLKMACAAGDVETRTSASFSLGYLYIKSGDVIAPNLSRAECLMQAKRCFESVLKDTESESKPVACLNLGDLFLHQGAAIAPSLTPEERIAVAIEYYSKARREGSPGTIEAAEEGLKECEEMRDTNRDSASLFLYS